MGSAPHRSVESRLGSNPFETSEIFLGFLHNCEDHFQLKLLMVLNQYLIVTLSYAKLALSLRRDLIRQILSLSYVK